MRQLLFVDDEVHVLRAMERMLRSHAGEWECHFSDDPRQALDMLEGMAPVAMVSDMLMPGMDGADLLLEAAKRHPAMVRVILSGEIGQGALLRMARGAHQVISKPCSGTVLVGLLRRAVGTPMPSGMHALAPGLYGLATVPLPAAHLDELRQELAQPAGGGRLVALVERSPGIASKLMQVATWNAIGYTAPPSSVEEAVVQLGVPVLRALANSTLLTPWPASHTTDHQVAVWRRCEAVAQAARQLAADARLDAASAAEVATLAVRTAAAPLVMDAACRPQHAEIRRRADAMGEPLHELEHAAFGVSAEEAMGRLWDLWGLPPLGAGRSARATTDESRNDAVAELAERACREAGARDNAQDGAVAPGGDGARILAPEPSGPAAASAVGV